MDNKIVNQGCKAHFQGLNFISSVLYCFSVTVKYRVRGLYLKEAIEVLNAYLIEYNYPPTLSNIQLQTGRDKAWREGTIAFYVTNFNALGWEAVRLRLQKHSLMPLVPFTLGMHQQ